MRNAECGIELRKFRTVPTLRIEITGQLQRECQSLEDESMVDEQKKVFPILSLQMQVMPYPGENNDFRFPLYINDIFT